MRVLSIGNSFSEDAHKWLRKLAVLNGVQMETLNLCNSGCSLERHWNHMQKNAAAYSFQTNGIQPPWKIPVTLEGALRLTDWDVITIQQVSAKTGLPETYEPYLSDIVALIRKLQPKAELWLHQSWAYEIDAANHEEYAKYYDNNQKKMYDCIVKTTAEVAASISAKVIPAGQLIQTIRETVPEFDYANGGKTLCRDGFHMTLDYGRFAVAAIWLRTLTGIQVKAKEFEDFDPALIQKILNVVNAQ